jgi:hypothetical protein
MFVALGIQHEKRMCRSIFPSVVSSRPYFSTLSNKRRDFRGGGGEVGSGTVIEHEMCVLIFSAASFRNTSHTKKY